jgi:ABC-type antimicrobial peptide transport system permease subunit
MALGAPRANILRLVISSTAVMLAAGVGVGLALSLALDHIVRAWAGGGSPRDPVTLFLAALILIMVATLACVIPAWRAATVNPVVALRYE